MLHARDRLVQRINRIDPAAPARGNHYMPNTKTTPILADTIAVRLTTDECRALYELARAQDRSVSYVVRAELRKFLREQRRTA